MQHMNSWGYVWLTWQAGVAMGLAKAVAVRFPDWGPDFVFLMVGPPCTSLYSSMPQVLPCLTAHLCAHARAAASPGLTPPVYVQMSVIMMNLFAGPPIFRSALMSTGEARALQLPLTFSDIKSPQ